MLIPNYTLVHDMLREKNHIARAGIFVHKSVNFVVRNDLTNQDEAHVAITAHITKSKKINIHSWYRQWQQIQGNNKIPNTGSTKAQKARMISTIDKFQIYIQKRRPYMGLCSCQFPGLLKSFNRSDKTKCVKKMC